MMPPQLIIRQPESVYVEGQHVFDWMRDELKDQLEPLFPCRVTVTYRHDRCAKVLCKHTGIATGIGLGQLQFYAERTAKGGYMRIGAGLIQEVIVW